MDLAQGLGHKILKLLCHYLFYTCVYMGMGMDV